MRTGLPYGPYEREAIAPASEDGGLVKHLLPPVRFQAYPFPMSDIAKWFSLLFITVVAISPIFEVFDNTDSLAQDTFDFSLYTLCLVGFRTFALSRTVITLRLTSFHKWILGPMHRFVGDVHYSATLPGTADHALFLTLHDLRI